MQVVIDIPDTEIPIERAMDTITLFFKNGHVYKCKYPFKELPKGHGRLIDADALLDTDRLIVDSMKCHYIPMMDIYDAPTIIEADKAEGSDKK